MDPPACPVGLATRLQLHFSPRHPLWAVVFEWVGLGSGYAYVGSMHTLRSLCLMGLLGVGMGAI